MLCESGCQLPKRVFCHYVPTSKRILVPENVVFLCTRAFIVSDIVGVEWRTKPCFVKNNHSFKVVAAVGKLVFFLRIPKVTSNNWLSSKVSTHYKNGVTDVKKIFAALLWMMIVLIKAFCCSPTMSQTIKMNYPRSLQAARCRHLLGKTELMQCTTECLVHCKI